MQSIFETIHFNPVDFLFQCINIIIIIFFLNKFLFKRVSKILDERKKNMDKNLNDVEKAWKEIKKKEEEYIDILFKAQKESKTILEKSNKESKNIKNQIIEKAKIEAKNILNNAKKNIEEEKKKILSSMQKEVSSMISDSVRAILKTEIDENIHKKLISNFIKETGDLN